MPRPFFKKFTTAGGAQNVRTEKVSAQEWSQVPGDEIFVVEQLGIFGAATVKLDLLADMDFIIGPSGECQATSFDGDMLKVPALNLAVGPSSKLRLYSTDSAAAPAGEVLVIKGTFYKIGEL